MTDRLGIRIFADTEAFAPATDPAYTKTTLDDRPSVSVSLHPSGAQPTVNVFPDFVTIEYGRGTRRDAALYLSTVGQALALREALDEAIAALEAQQLAAMAEATGG